MKTKEVKWANSGYMPQCKLPTYRSVGRGREAIEEDT